jgi:hypothetical protein
MEGNTQERNGRSDPASDEESERLTALFDSTRRFEFAKAGLEVARPNLVLNAERFWYLMREGWKFVVAEDGSILSYIAPSLEERLAALTDNANLARKQAAKKTNHRR